MATRDGELLTYWHDGWAMRGHASQQELQDAVRAWAGNEVLTIGPVQHRWWRFVPNGEWPDEGMVGYYIDAVPGSRGAFRVTHCEPSEALP